MADIPVPRDCLLAMLAVCTTASAVQPADSSELAKALDRLKKHVPELLVLADRLDPRRKST